jgi:hypothetical protein
MYVGKIQPGIASVIVFRWVFFFTICLLGYSSEMLKDEKTMFVCSQPNNALLFVKGRKQNEN